MKALGMEERRKVQIKKKCKVARPHGKIVVGVRRIKTRNMKGSEVKKNR